MSSVLHPIQLKEILVQHLQLEIFNPTVVDSDKLVINFNMRTGHSEFDDDTSLIMVGVQGEVNQPDSIDSFYIKVEIKGIFEVDTKIFPQEQISKWAEQNAPLLLLPYLRENIYSLSSRARLNFLIPLHIIPTIKIDKTSKP